VYAVCALDTYRGQGKATDTYNIQFQLEFPSFKARFYLPHREKKDSRRERYCILFVDSGREVRGIHRKKSRDRWTDSTLIFHKHVCYTIHIDTAVRQ
jgi:hypothetical protein